MVPLRRDSPKDGTISESESPFDVLSRVISQSGCEAREAQTFIKLFRMITFVRGANCAAKPASALPFNHKCGKDA